MKEYNIIQLLVNMNVADRITTHINMEAREGWKYKDLKHLENIGVLLLIMEREKTGESEA